MKYIGAHFSISGGLENVIIEAYKLNATALSFFTKNQRKWFVSPLSMKSINSFKKFCKLYKYSSFQILPHASYLINLGNPDIEKRKLSQLSLMQEIQRCYFLGLSMINIHPGYHLNRISELTCLKYISNSINLILEKTKFIKIVLENTAGQGTSIGYCFEHLFKIIDNIDDKSRIGVCIDTCHLFASGYEIRNFSDFLSTFRSFHDIVNIKYLSAMHINDSLGNINSKIDRHHNIGLGFIKKNFFSWVMRTKQFENIPFILETKDHRLWKEEIIWLKKRNSYKNFNIF